MIDKPLLKLDILLWIVITAASVIVYTLACYGLFTLLSNYF